MVDLEVVGTKHPPPYGSDTKRPSPYGLGCITAGRVKRLVYTISAQWRKNKTQNPLTFKYSLVYLIDFIKKVKWKGIVLKRCLFCF